VETTGPRAEVEWEAGAGEWAADVELERVEVWAETVAKAAREEMEVEPCRKCTSPIARKTFVTTCSFRMG
jgi:hypothetical protein